MNRTDKFRSLLNAKEYDATIIFNRTNITYLSGYTGSETALFITQDKALFLADSRNTLQAKIEANDYEVIDIGRESLATAAAELVNKYGCKKVGIEAEVISLATYRNLKKTADVSYEDVGKMLLDMRAVKDKSEIENIQKACDIACAALDNVVPLIKPGIKEVDIALEIEYYFKKNGSEGVSFDTIVGFQENAAMAHARPSGRQLKNNEFVLIDFGCKFNGYCSDMTRTFAVGNVSKEQKKVYNIVLDAQKAALDAIVPNMKASSLHNLAKDVIAKAGYGDFFGHGLGHGIGMDVHEAPGVRPNSNDILVPGNVFSVEPGIYLENKFGVRIEDLVYMEENGYTNLIKYNKELTII